MVESTYLRAVILVYLLSMPTEIICISRTGLMAKRNNDEFRIALRDIAQFGLHTLNKFDRVKAIEWIRKISAVSQDNIEMVRLRNEYAQLLRLMVQTGILHGPFKDTPPDSNLPPLPESINKIMCKEIKDLPKSGPIMPIINHTSPDGQVYVSMKELPDGGMYCYMACSPDGLNKV